MKRTQKGFTLVELLVVIAILAILATVSVVGYTSFIDRANESNAQTEADQIKTIIETGLLADDYVKLTDEIYATKGDDGKITFAKSPNTTGKKVFDATDDIKGLVGTDLGALKIGTESSNLVYTRYGYDVDVMTRAATKVN